MVGRIGSWRAGGAGFLGVACVCLSLVATACNQQNQTSGVQQRFVAAAGQHAGEKEYLLHDEAGSESEPLFLVSQACATQPADLEDYPSQCGYGVDATLTLDVGGTSDTNTSNPIFLITGEGISGPLTEGAISYRTLLENYALQFQVNASAVPSGDMTADGVPHHHAIVDIEFKDVVDEAQCEGSDDYTARCRPYLETRLDWGNATESESWFAVGSFAGADESTSWSTARFFFEANPWQMLRVLPPTGAGYLYFRIKYPHQASAWAPLPINTITLRFLSDSCFNALREDDREKRTLIRSDYEETNSLNSSNYPNQDYVIYKRNYLEKIYPTTVPQATEVIAYSATPPPNAPPDLTAFEVRGQTEPVTFAFYAFQSLTGVEIQPGTLTRQDGREAVEGEITAISSSKILVRKVVAIDKRWAYSYDAYYGLQPWYLDDDATFNLAAQKSQQVWLLVDVPANAAPGTYTGNIAIQTTQGIPASRNLTLALVVYDVALEQPDTPAVLCHSPYIAGSSYYAKTPEVAVADMAALGVYSVDTWFCPTWTWDEENCVPGNCDVVVDNLSSSALAELQGLKDHGLLGEEFHCVVSDNGWKRALWGRLCFDEYSQPIPYCEGNCPEFDDKYIGILQAYADLYHNWDPYDPNGVSMAVAFVDEAGNDPVKRREANHLNRLAQAAGLKTLATFYYPASEEPLAGWTFRFRQLTGGITPTQPSWILSDPHLMAHWDFSQAGNSAQDLSGHGNTAFIMPPWAAADGMLVMQQCSNGYMYADHNPNGSLNLTNAGTMFFWFKPTDFTHLPANQGTIWKMGNTGYEANYHFRFCSDNVGNYNDRLLRFYAWYPGISAAWASGAVAFTNDDLNDWCSIIWVYDADNKGTMYVNGAPFSTPAVGPLTPTTGEFQVGQLTGYLDDLAILNRTVTEDEVAALITVATESEYTEKQIAISLTLPGGNLPLDNTLRFALGDRVRTPAITETTKMLIVNNEVVWQANALAHPYDSYSVDLTNYLDAKEDNNLQWVFTNGNARDEDISLYLLDAWWRGQGWTVDESPDPHWTVTSVEDAIGDLAPMSSYLDEPIFSLYYMNQEARDYSRQWASRSFYLPSGTTQAVPVNNRYVYGLYAGAVSMPESLVYAYADWGSEPWDDEEMWADLRSCGDRHAERGPGGYQLVMPSWEDKVYHTVAYESLREGLEDSQVVATLKAAIAANPGSPTTQPAQDYLEDVLARPNPQFGPRYLSCGSATPIETYADRSGEVLTDLSGSADDYAIFDEIRLRMIRHIRVIVDGVDDCNSNGIPDEYDIAEATSQDCNDNGIPDECDIAQCLGEMWCRDCNDNGVPDGCDIAQCTSQAWCGDCNENDIPDGCDIDLTDPDGDSLYYLDTVTPDGVPDVCTNAVSLSFDCNNNSIPDVLDIALEYSEDCNGNGIPDECDIDPNDPDGNLTVSMDSNSNGVPDECEWGTLP